ncbi:MAG: hypothetical protein H9535_11575 [Ignavibacteria bacterium]|nr:hypothetical protein [Ignavibacteria bacterium]
MSKTLTIFTILTISVLLTVFFTVHESLPRLVRSLTSLLLMPVAIASGISRYASLGIPVYDSIGIVCVVNLIGVIIAFSLVRLVILRWKTRKLRESLMR